MKTSNFISDKPRASHERQWGNSSKFLISWKEMSSNCTQAGDRIFTWTRRTSNSRIFPTSPTAPERKDFVANIPKMTEALLFSCLLAKTSSIYGRLLALGTTSTPSLCLPSHTFPSNSHCFPLIFESPPLYK